MLEKLAIFDIDYTITKRETQLELYRYMIKRDKRVLHHLPTHVVTGLLYAFKVNDEKKTKERFLKFLEGKSRDEVEQLVRDFYNDCLSNLLYKDAVDMIKKLKKQGCKIYLISASPEFYLKGFYNIKEVDKIIGTRFYNDGKVFKSKIEGNNCKGQEKVRRLIEELKKENIEVDFKKSYMFSDSLSDLPLLNLVGNPYLINYKKCNTIKILKWK